MNRVSIALVVSIAVVASLFLLLPKQPTPISPKAASSNAQGERANGDVTSADQPSSMQRDAGIVNEDHSPIVIYCAASNRAVMEKIRQAFEQESGQLIQVQYGPSQSLLASIEIAKQADLYIPADDSYLHLARSKSLLSESYPLARCEWSLPFKKATRSRLKYWRT